MMFLKKKTEHMSSSLYKKQENCQLCKPI